MIAFFSTLIVLVGSACALYGQYAGSLACVPWWFALIERVEAGTLLWCSIVLSYELKSSRSKRAADQISDEKRLT